MAISSSSGSNSLGDSSSSSSPSSSSSLSASYIDSIPESREPTPEWDPIAAYEALAPLHWDAEEFDFGIASEEDEPNTEGEEDLQFLFQEELESSEEDVFSWEGADSSEEIGSPPSDDTAAGGNPHQFLQAPTEGSEEEAAAAAGEATAAPRTTAAIATTTMMTTTTAETPRREARSAVGIQTPTTGRCR